MKRGQALSRFMLTPPPLPPLTQEFQSVLTTSIDAIGAYSQNNPSWKKTSIEQGVVEAALPSWIKD